MTYALAELIDVVTDQGIGPAGPMFSHHPRMSPETLDFERGVPVKGPVSSSGRVTAGQLPEATVPRTIYRGPCEGLAVAWGEFDAWTAAQGHTPAPDLWECYLTGPQSVPDPATWRTEFNRPMSRTPR
jgi:effector-binding domain-containing protein